jgi:hypothetical protein
MSAFNWQAHWQNVYRENEENQVSWFYERPTIASPVRTMPAPRRDRQ